MNETNENNFFETALRQAVQKNPNQLRSLLGLENNKDQAFRQAVRDNPNQFLPLLGLKDENVKVITSTKETTYIAMPYETDEVALEAINAAGGIPTSTASTICTCLGTASTVDLGKRGTRVR